MVAGICQEHITRYLRNCRRIGGPHRADHDPRKSNDSEGKVPAPEREGPVLEAPPLADAQQYGDAVCRAAVTTIHQACQLEATHTTGVRAQLCANTRLESRCNAEGCK